MWSSTGNPDKKSTKTSQNGKTEKSEDIWEENETDNTRKNNFKTWGNKAEGSSERRNTKGISAKSKKIQIKQYIPKERNKILSTIGWAWHKNTQPEARETERFWTKIWQPEKHNEKAEWINDMARELEGLEESHKAEVHIELLKKTLKKISNWKMTWHNGIYEFWFKKFT